MPYQIVIRPRVERQIARWPMPDTLLVDCYLRLRSLRDRPATQLVRGERPFDGLMLPFECIDPTDRLVVHRFAFQAVYGMDEETLFIEAAAHERFTIGA